MSLAATGSLSAQRAADVSTDVMTRKRQKPRFPAFLSPLLGKICEMDSNMVKCEKHPH